MKEGIERIFIKESGAKIGIIPGWGYNPDWIISTGPGA